MMEWEVAVAVPGAARSVIQGWRRGVSSVEDLAAVRGRGGLTVTQVSQTTGYGAAISRGIDQDHYRAGGGYFYAGGHIRASAGGVGADPGAWMAEYDAAHRRPQAAPAADLFPPVKPVKIRQRH